MNSINLYKGLITILFTTLIASTGISQQRQSKINYTSFSVNRINERIMIDWSTAKDAAKNYFEIQRSLDGSNFKTIAIVFGPDPQKTDMDRYEGYDKLTPQSKKYFYRLKYVGMDGEVDLSETRMLAIN